MRVIIVGGVPAGALIVGLGSRAAMLVLRLTSPPRVNGVISDDGFVIGRVTLGGTYNLMLIGAAVGIIGAGAYRLVAPRLIGPLWFRRVTTGLASAAVGGAMLVHSDGIDFNLLEPLWLAIGLFVALPGIFGVLIGASVDAVSRPDSWTRSGRRRWALPAIAVICFPPVAVIVGVAAVVIVLSTLVDLSDVLSRLRRSAPYVLIIRAVWLAIAVAGLVALVNDVTTLT